MGALNLTSGLFISVQVVIEDYGLKNVPMRYIAWSFEQDETKVNWKYVLFI